MDMSLTGWKFLYVISIPPILLVLAVIGGDNWTGYGEVASFLVVIGGMCLSSVMGRSRARIAAGIGYVVILELLLLFLP